METLNLLHRCRAILPRCCSSLPRSGASTFPFLPFPSHPFCSYKRGPVPFPFVLLGVLLCFCTHRVGASAESLNQAANRLRVWRRCGRASCECTEEDILPALLQQAMGSSGGRNPFVTQLKPGLKQTIASETDLIAIQKIWNVPSKFMSQLNPHARC